MMGGVPLLGAERKTLQGFHNPGELESPQLGTCILLDLQTCSLLDPTH